MHSGRARLPEATYCGSVMSASLQCVPEPCSFVRKPRVLCNIHGLNFKSASALFLQMRGVLGEALRLQLLRRLGETEEHWRRHQARVAAGADPLGP